MTVGRQIDMNVEKKIKNKGSQINREKGAKHCKYIRKDRYLDKTENGQDKNIKYIWRK